MGITKELESEFLNADEKERYEKHITLEEIGIKGQVELKKSSVLCLGAGVLGS